MFTNRWFYLLIVIALVAVVGVTIRDAFATSELTRTNTEIASLVAMRDLYTTRQVQKAQFIPLSLDGYAVRWVTISDFYTTTPALETGRSQRSLDAETARWVAMGEYYTTMPALEMGRSQRSLDAEIARWVAMGEYYTTNK